MGRVLMASGLSWVKAAPGIVLLPAVTPRLHVQPSTAAVPLSWAREEILAALHTDDIAFLGANMILLFEC